MDWKDKIKFWGKKGKEKRDDSAKEVKAVSQTAKQNKGAEKVLKPKAEAVYAYKILKRPLVTEKSTVLGGENKYTFEIANDANKIEISKAIYDLYGERPKKVNIIKSQGKKVRWGKSMGQRKNWKKAIITLKPGVKLELYEGV